MLTMTAIERLSVSPSFPKLRLQRKEAVALVGPPVSGKSTITSLYPTQLIQVGEYAHSLPETHPLKARCMEHWRASTVFSPSLVEALLQSHPKENHDWYILDGTPRDIASVPFVEKFFDIGALIELTVDETIWMERAQRVASNGRSHTRHDSSLPQLLKRKAVYEEKMEPLRSYFPRRYVVDNSGNMEATREQFRSIIAEVFPQ